MADKVILDKVLFRKLFAEFADPATYPDAVIDYRWTEATNYITDDNVGDLMDAKRVEAVSCMTAHLMRLAKVIAAAGAGGAALSGVVIGATIDKVAVQLQAPPSRGAWGHWLAQTPYGQQLTALLAAQAAGGMYVGGYAERAAFRKVGGVF